MKFEKIQYVERKTKTLKTENVPSENLIKFLYYNPFGEISLEALVKRKFLTKFYGSQMDKKSSVKKIPDFVKSLEIDMSESEKKIDDFVSFNDFFTRKLKPDARPIDKNSESLVSPADGKILVFENLSETTKFFLKGENFSLQEFLKDEKLAKKYEGGTFIIVRLAPVDYHRFHFPADGKISENKKIDGYYYSVSPHAIKRNFRIFCENKREYSELATEKFGDILLVEVAATMVGGMTQTYSPKSFVKKGDEKGYFYFGGSTTIMLLEKDKVKIDSDILENSKKGLETKIYMGEKIGVTLK
ncbi:MAG: phosphatidylserine decarboxylase [Fusobacteriaceae bacterium]